MKIERDKHYISIISGTVVKALENTTENTFFGVVVECKCKTYNEGHQDLWNTKSFIELRSDGVE